MSSTSPSPIRRRPFARMSAGAIVAALAMNCARQERPENVPAGATATMPAESVADAIREPTCAGLSNSDTYYVVYTTTPDPIPLNEMFSIDVRVFDGAARATPVEGITLRADGRMPAHRHGMNTAPRVEPVGPGQFRVRGMLFHMPGDWELDFDIERDGLVERAQFAVTLE